MAEKMKVKEIEPKIKEIKTESKKNEFSELEQEVSDESIISQMPSGNFDTSLPINLRGQQLDEGLDSSVTQTRNENIDVSSRSTYGTQPTQRELEAKYQVSSLAEQRFQTAIGIARERENLRTQSNFENPDLRQFGSSQTGEGEYDGRISTSDVSIKRRNLWEGG
jgi:hypothetical protein